MTVTGKLTNESGKFILADEATKTRYEIRGKGFEQLVRSRVNVTGELIAGENGSGPIILVTSAAKVGGAIGGGSAAALVVVGAAGGAAAVGGVALTTGDDEPASRP